MNAILAVSGNNAIGYKGRMPWSMSKEDMGRFVRLTNGKEIIMGRKTFESFKKPLKNRRHIVLTRDTGYRHPKATIVHSKEDAIKTLNAPGSAWIIGGAEIYEMFKPETNEWHISIFPGKPPADTFFAIDFLCKDRILLEQEICTDHIYQRWL